MNDSIPTISTPTWVPKDYSEIAGKERLYKTARVKVNGRVVQLEFFDEDSRHFRVGSDAWYHWRDLDSFCL